MTKPPTKNGEKRLSEVASRVALPKGIVSTGWPGVRKKCLELGITFRPWQPDIGRAILAKRDDGKYAASIGGTGLSIPRQVGKTFIVSAIVFALCLLRPKLTVIWSAHRVRTAEETFGKMQAFAKRKKIAPHIKKIVLGSGDEAIEFRNGSRILFGARAAGFGRGFDEVDVVVYDEAQILDQAALDDMVPATNQSRQPEGALLLFMGTPPRPNDPSDVFTDMRTDALSGEDEDTIWIEIGADDGYEFTPLPAPLTEEDWAQIAKANPSFPQDTPREAILRMRKKLGADSFRREGAGVWDKVGKPQPIALRSWQALAVEDVDVPDSPPDYYALSVSPERMAYIAVAIRDGDKMFLDLAEVDRMDDSRLVVKWFLERKAKYRGRRMTVAIDSRDPAAALIGELRAAGIQVNALTQSDCGRACVGLATDVDAGVIEHVNQPAVTKALLSVDKKLIGKAGLWEFDPECPADELAGLRAITNARYGLTLQKIRKAKTKMVVRS